MINKALFVTCLVLVGFAGFSQQHMPNRVNTYSDEGTGTGFQKANLFLGGSLSFGFGTDNFNVGGSPEIGYSLNKWLDAGVLVNLNYNYTKADPYYDGNISFKSFNYGGGVFARAYVLPFLFFTVQPEYNWIDYTYTDMNFNPSTTTKYNTTAPSLLLGIGYGRRVVGQSGFYIALLFDALDNVNSPYNDINGHPLPVFRAGFDFYLHPHRY
jgi:hypothetical protein